MPLMRNPFKKQDENARPIVEKTVVNGDVIKTASAKEKSTVEYQLSEINDSGVYLPPTPVERKTFFGMTPSRSTTTSSINRCTYNENEPFNISRESFDSYRRSFDISARSPVIQPEARPRASLDSRTFFSPPRASLTLGRQVQVPQTQEEDTFEDISIDDPKPQQPKKRGILSRIVDSNETAPANETKPAWHHFGGRKRGQSGQGAELKSIPKGETVVADKRASQLAQSQPAAEPAHPALVENTRAPEITVDS